MSTDQAESIALQALAFLASDSELLPRFLALTGIDPGEIRKAAAEPGFLAGVLAFFMAHEPSLLKLAEVSRAEAGGSPPHMPCRPVTIDMSNRHERRS
jgi:hypothetical protein